MVDGEEIKLELFADDLTAFLLNDNSLLKFFELLKSFGECSGLKINHDKSEIMPLGDYAHSSSLKNTNVLLSKIGIIPSPACSFCEEADESLEHIFVTCHYTKKFWAEVIKWVGNLGIEIEPLSDKDVMFGIYIYSCRGNKIKP